MNKVLVVAVHPDDETLGAGGSLNKWKKEGKSIHWLLVTVPNADVEFLSEDSVDKKLKEIELVKDKYDFDSFNSLNYSPTTLDKVEKTELVSGFKSVFDKIKPDTVILPFHGDAHSDHRVVFGSAMAALKSFRSPYVKSILMMETLSETEYAPALLHNAFIPNVFVDISDSIEDKIESFKIYESENGNHPFPRSTSNIKALAHLRGATVGVEAAEAFMLLRCILS